MWKVSGTINVIITLLVHVPLGRSVCSDLELRFIDRNVEVCISDQWHVVVDSAVVNNITLGSIMSIPKSTTVTIVWTPPPDLEFSKYDASCTNEKDGQIHTVKLAALDANMLTINIGGLRPSTDYTCCVTAHTRMSPRIDTLNMACTETRTLADSGVLELNSSSATTAIGLGVMGGFCVVLLIIFTACGLFLLQKYRKNAVYVTAARLM